jgi:hypothetical protein
MDISSFNYTISGNTSNNYSSIVSISSLVYNQTNSINTISGLIPTLQPLLTFSTNLIGNTIDLSNSLIVSNLTSYTQITPSAIIMASVGYGQSGQTSQINKSNLASLDTTTSLTQQLSQFQKSYYYTCGASMLNTTPPSIQNHSCVVAFNNASYAAVVVLSFNYYLYQGNNNSATSGIKSNIQGMCLVSVQMDTTSTSANPVITTLYSTNTSLFSTSTLYYSSFVPITIQRNSQGSIGINFGFPTSFNNSYGGNLTSGQGTSYYINSYGASVEIVSSMPNATSNGFMTTPFNVNYSSLGSNNSMRGNAYIIGSA